MINDVVRRREHIEEDEDPDAPLASDQDSPSMMDVIDCPYCGQPISDLAEQCSRCGNYVNNEDAPPSKETRRTVIATLIIVVLLSLAFVFLH